MSPPVQMDAAVNLNHCARFVFLSRAVDLTESPSNGAKVGPHVKPRFRHDLGSRVTSHFAVSNASSGLRSLRCIFRFRLRLATDMRDETVGAHRGKRVSWRLIFVHVLWQDEGCRVWGVQSRGGASAQLQ